MNLLQNIKFGPDGLVPVGVVDAESKRLLVLCFMNDEALRRTLETGKVHTYSRSRGRVALKGESSGHMQTVKRVLVNCNADSLCIEVEQAVAACHEGYFSCYFRQADPQTGELTVVDERVFDPEEVYRS